jgi:dTDP-4-dehydrorhamnose reductase
VRTRVEHADVCLPQALTHLPTRTLLIGSSGQLGRALAVRFAGRTLTTASHQHARGEDVRIDLGDASATQSALRDARPDLILVAGAMCNVDRCETEPAICERTNTRGPAVVAEYARTHGARVVLFSTDHVFDGTRAAYVETDTVNPLNVYARSKAFAEDALRELVPDRHLIVRTGWVYGPDWQRRNFVLRLVDRVRAGEQVPVPGDQWGSPTYTDDIASATRHLVDRGEAGTFHATGPDLLNRVALAQEICRKFGLDLTRLLDQPTSALGQPARRPLRVRLDCRKLQATGAVPFRTVAAGLGSLAEAGDV